MVISRTVKKRVRRTHEGTSFPAPYAIARLMGHASIQTSMIYVHPEPESLRKAVG